MDIEKALKILHDLGVEKNPAAALGMMRAYQPVAYMECNGLLGGALERCMEIAQRQEAATLAGEEIPPAEVEALQADLDAAGEKLTGLAGIAAGFRPYSYGGDMDDAP